MEIIKIKEDVTVINDSYNASYDSIKASLEYLKALKGSRKIAVLGDMLELGEYTQKILHLTTEKLSQPYLLLLYSQ